MDLKNMLGRPKFKANGVEYLVLPTKATSQNIKFEKDGSTWYVPLASGTAGGYAMENGKSFKLGYLKVGDKYGAVGVNDVPEITIIHQPNAIYDKIYPINPLEFNINDHDNDVMNVTLTCVKNSSGTLSEVTLKTWSNKLNGNLIYTGDIYTTGGINGLSTIVLKITVTDSKGGSNTKTINYNTYAKFDNKIYWVDYNTHYTGSNEDNYNVIRITSHSGSGTPLFCFTGFSSSDIGKTVKWDIYKNGVSVKNVSLTNCAVYNNPVIGTFDDRFNDVTGITTESRIGVNPFSGWIPNGDYIILIVVDDSPTKVRDYGRRIIMEDGGNVEDDGEASIKYLIVNGSTPSVGNSYTSNSTEAGDYKTVWASSASVYGNDDYLISFTAMPSGTTFTVDGIISRILVNPGTQGYSGGNGVVYAYKCFVH